MYQENLEIYIYICPPGYFPDKTTLIVLSLILFRETITKKSFHFTFSSLSVSSIDGRGPWSARGPGTLQPVGAAVAVREGVDGAAIAVQVDGGIRDGGSGAAASAA